MSLDICDYNHEPVTYSSSNRSGCPVCEKQEELDEKESEISDKEQEIANLEEELSKVQIALEEILELHPEYKI